MPATRDLVWSATLSMRALYSCQTSIATAHAHKAQNQRTAESAEASGPIENADALAVCGRLSEEKEGSEALSAMLRSALPSRTAMAAAGNRDRSNIAMPEARLRKARLFWFYRARDRLAHP